MLSYQHAFHAGNHADVIKHITIIAIIEKLCKKPKPFFYLDTHAGEGAYSIDLNATINTKHDEVLAKKVFDLKGKSPLLSIYKKCIETYINDTLNPMYPGSPLMVKSLIDAFYADVFGAKNSLNAHLNELHPTAYGSLRKNLRDASSNFHFHQRDAFELLNAMLPPTPNRGVAVIDPPYEQAKEYDDVCSALAKALQKWPQGTFAIWYPLLSPTRIDKHSKTEVDTPKSGLSENMIENIKRIATKGLLNVVFAPQAPSPYKGMYGSGMLVVNPPWQLDLGMQSVLDDLAAVENNDGGVSRVEFLVPLA